MLGVLAAAAFAVLTEAVLGDLTRVLAEIPFVVLPEAALGALAEKLFITLAETLL